VRALELLIEAIDRDKLYAGVKGAQLWSQLGKSDVLMIPAKYWEEVADPNPNPNPTRSPTTLALALALAPTLTLTL